MDVQNTGQQSELDELLELLPRYHRLLQSQMKTVSVIELDNFFVTPNYFSSEIEQYFLSQNAATEANQVEPTIPVSVFQQNYFESFKQCVFADNLPVFVINPSNGAVLNHITPCTEDRRLCGLLVTNDNDGFMIQMVNLDRNEIYLLGFHDNANFTYLASLLLQLQISDVYCVDLADSLVGEFLDRQNVFYRVSSALPEYEQEIDNRIHFKFRSVFMECSDQCLCLFQAMLREADIKATDITIEKYEFLTADLNEFMRISAFDLEALDMQQIQDQFAAKCLTDAGKAVAKLYFSRILCDAGAITARQEALRRVGNNDFSATLRMMPRIWNCNNYVFHIEGTDFLRECLLLQRCLQAYDSACDYAISAFAHSTVPEIVQLTEEATADCVKEFVNVILRYLIPNDNIFEKISGFREIFVNPNMQDDLCPIFQRMKETYDEMCYELDEFCIACRLSDFAIFGMVFSSGEVVFTSKTAAYLQDIRECDRGAEILSEHVKTGVRFTNPRMRELQHQFMAAIEEYREQQLSLVAELRTEVRPFETAVGAVVLAVGFFDFWQSVAQLAKEHRLTFPEFGDHLELEGLNSFKLLLSGSYTVKNSLDLSAPLTFITGANSGGKTTLLKAVAVSQVLAEIGLPVAAMRMVTHVFSSAAFVFCSGDDISRGKSTFLLEIEVLQCLIDAAGENTLVLIDEIGRGTSAADGFGISVGALEALLRRESHVLAITHLLEVVEHFNKQSGCVSYRMRVVERDDGIQMLYEAERGIDDSKGLRVARMCGFDEEMMDIADLLVNRRAGWKDEYNCSLSVEELMAVLIKLRLGLLTKEETEEEISQTKE